MLIGWDSTIDENDKNKVVGTKFSAKTAKSKSKTR